jgi:aquaporin related protein
MLAAEKHKGTFLAPIGIGLALFIAELSGVYYTGGSLNPARTFGADVANRKFSGYEWIYWVGPFLGSIIAVVFYRFIKHLEYETANPGQDFDEHEQELFNPSGDPMTRQEVRRPNAAAELGLNMSTPGNPVEPRQSSVGNAVLTSSPGMEKGNGRDIV